MVDEITLDGEIYVSSRQAAKSTGYAQDYVGQLARKGHIDARRVGGLWYISAKSLEKHQEKSAEYAPKPPENKEIKTPDTIVSFDGRDYVSATRAASITGYNKDYLGQLARGGKVMSQQVGNRWYFDRESIMSHKSSKDSQLATVQSKSVGIDPAISTLQSSDTESNAVIEDESYKSLVYTHEAADLLPLQQKKQEGTESLTKKRSYLDLQEQVPVAVVGGADALARQIPIRVVEGRKIPVPAKQELVLPIPVRDMEQRKSIFIKVFFVFAALVILASSLFWYQVSQSRSSIKSRSLSESPISSGPESDSVSLRGGDRLSHAAYTVAQSSLFDSLEQLITAIAVHTE